MADRTTTQRPARRRRRAGRRSTGEQRERTQEVPQEKPLSGPAFWMIVGVAAIKDLVDLFAGLTILLGLLLKPFSLVFAFTIFLYLWLSGVQFTTRKLATVLFYLIIELTPILAIIPMNVGVLLITRQMEHNDALKRAAQGAEA